MKLDLFIQAAAQLPEEILALPVAEIKIREYNNSLVLIHKNHRPRIFSEGTWEILRPKDW